MLLQMTKSAVYTVPGVKEATIDLVWTPPWDPRTMCSEDAKATLGIWD
jgi:metal-sulfur cluster biosynthetic enzyme